MDNIEWMGKAKEVIVNAIHPNQPFELKKLFPGHEWESLTAGDRRSFGRFFSSEVKEGRFDIVERYGEGKSHHTLYVKKQ